jgi:Ca2+/Na+ antiporter
VALSPCATVLACFQRRSLSNYHDENASKLGVCVNGFFFLLKNDCRMWWMFLVCQGFYYFYYFLNLEKEEIHGSTYKQPFFSFFFLG